ncbi:polysaccharide biosynthesis-domain-containing protein [Tricharina praecox]|uniref:polysaccharide biosynthesis-domain-containing protein n=1 Tax=Tricharina praecox TaxID=43433 RepID=UPI00222036D8|nr:polysaccharide biosynthesis-domain-containing protein [Tricharina praecox]KAI5858438.1 polysaccharide biosynthesis-domain-containing protein [Tricharina praecox]
MSVARQVPKKFTAEEAENLEDIEKQFAVKAVIHAQTYWNILQKRRGTDLRLTKLDDEIMAHLLEVFPDFDAAKELDEDRMKDKEGKEKWRSFMMKYEKTVEDYNFGTLLRRTANAEYEEKTTMFAPRMQFYAVEIARNRAGLNDWIYDDARKEEEKEKAAAGN